MSNTTETLATLWNNDNATLVGFGDGYSESIDRDQAVDEYGNAVFDSYAFQLGDGYTTDIRTWKFSAADIEEFARTW